jgi:cell division protein FtsI/penicillin-binding protein 2
VTTINTSTYTESSDQPCGEGRIDRIARAAAVGVLAVFAVMLARVVQLQCSPGRTLTPFISERINTVPELAPTGDLLDRRGLPVATSKFGERVFVDPIDFPNPPDEALVLLADALGMPVPDLAGRIVPAMRDNLEIIEARSDEEPPAETGRLRRYVGIGKTLEDWRADAVRGLKLNGRPIPGVHIETRPVREYTAAAVAANVVGMVGGDMVGLSGAERLYGPLMRPAPGSLQYVRDARGEPMWIFPGGYTPPERGRDVRLSVDLEIQSIVVEELRRGVEEADAAGGRCVVMDPYTGEILAMADVVRPCKDAREYDWNAPIPKGGNGTRYRIIPKDTQSKIDPALARNRCIEDVYEPGSTFKPFMWSACLMHGVTRPSEVFNTYGGHWTTPYGRHITDVHGKPRLAWTDVLIQSSNIGMAQGVARLSFPQARSVIVSLGFGHKPGLGLSGESPGMVTTEKAWSKYTQTSVAFGYEVGVTPVQMCRAFSAYCRKGELSGTIPTSRLTAIDSDTASRQPRTRVFPADIADKTRETMKGVTDILDGRMAAQKGKEEVFRYISFGKSGTAQAPLGKPPEGKRRPKGSDGYYGGQYNVSFIAGGPFEDPRLVVLVVVDDPGPELVRKKQYFGSQVAGPVNRRIMERALGYLGVQPSEEKGARAAAE